MCECDIGFPVCKECEGLCSICERETGGTGPHRLCERCRKTSQAWGDALAEWGRCDAPRGAR